LHSLWSEIHDFTKSKYVHFSSHFITSTVSAAVEIYVFTPALYLNSMLHCPWFKVEMVLCAREAQWSRLEAAGLVV